MKISLGSNIASLQAQRRLGKAMDSLSTTYERLSSGMRINRASDDAAGLAVSTALRTDSRVFTTALRNIGDGVSVLNLASSTLEQLSDIAIRQKELAEQSANGVYGVTQRRAMQSEFDALTDEFNRITTSTSFNNISLLNGSNTSLRIQAGYGVDGSISTSIGEELARIVGDGSFTSGAAMTSASFSSLREVEARDVNGDGLNDIVAVDSGNGRVHVLIGNGNGTFQAAKSYIANTNAYSFAFGDINSDGIQDIVAGNFSTDTISVLYGNSNGSFLAPVSFAVGDGPSAVQVGDFNRDGLIDIVAGLSNEDTVNVFFNNGNGTFRVGLSYDAAGIGGVNVGDVNNDSVLDIIAANNSSTLVFVSSGTGSFSEPFSIAASSGSVATADFNRDGYLDIIANQTGASGLTIALGNGNGSFRAAITLGQGQTAFDNVQITDLNGDGFEDIAVSGGYAGAYYGVLFGNGDGTFKNRVSNAAGSQPEGISYGDFNGDGAIDLVVSNTLATIGINVYLANATSTTSIGKISILTQAKAREALSVVDDTLTRIALEKGALGSHISRLSSATSTLQSSRENSDAASSRITDSDIAAESADYARLMILRDAASAVLGQANINPNLALQLIKN